jgi:hypothetical protein
MGDTKKPTSELHTTPHFLQPTEAAKALRALEDLLPDSEVLGPHRRYVLEKVDGELVFRQPELMPSLSRPWTKYLTLSHTSAAPAALSNSRREATLLIARYAAASRF